MPFLANPRGIARVRTSVGTEIKGERSEGAERQPLDRMSGPDAKRARAKSDLALLIALGQMGGWIDDSESGENGWGLH